VPGEAINRRVRWQVADRRLPYSVRAPVANAVRVLESNARRAVRATCPTGVHLRPATSTLKTHARSVSYWLPKELSVGKAPRYSLRMITKTKVLCAQCEQSEQRCECEKYCCFCQSQLDVRLCRDGLYYCEHCRRACDYKPVS